jgi:hypothetical protein
MSRPKKSFRPGDARTVFPLLIIVGVELIASVGLACANWNAGGTPENLSALSDWAALATPVVPLTVFFFLNLLP